MLVRHNSVFRENGPSSACYASEEIRHEHKNRSNQDRSNEDNIAYYCDVVRALLFSVGDLNTLFSQANTTTAREGEGGGCASKRGATIAVLQPKCQGKGGHLQDDRIQINLELKSLGSEDRRELH